MYRQFGFNFIKLFVDLWIRQRHEWSSWHPRPGFLSSSACPGRCLSLTSSCPPWLPCLRRGCHHRHPILIPDGPDCFLILLAGRYRSPFGSIPALLWCADLLIHLLSRLTRPLIILARWARFVHLSLVFNSTLPSQCVEFTILCLASTWQFYKRNSLINNVWGINKSLIGLTSSI